jgi:hypothetical protein
VPYGPYFVDIHAIMDKTTYDATVAACGAQGEKCTTPNSAPVCAIINAKKLIPGADVISVFSFDCVPEEGIAQIPCDKGLYAGCMTAPCYRDDDDPEGIVTCECPLYEPTGEIRRAGARHVREGPPQPEDDDDAGARSGCSGRIVSARKSGWPSPPSSSKRTDTSSPSP